MDRDQCQGSDQESLAVFFGCEPATGDTKYSDDSSAVRECYESTDNSDQDANKFDDFIYTHVLSPYACFFECYFKLVIIIF